MVTHRSAPPTAMREPSRSHDAFLNQPSKPAAAPGKVLYSLASAFGSPELEAVGANGRTSQIFVVSSADADRRCVPDGLRDREVTVSLWPKRE